MSVIALMLSAVLLLVVGAISYISLKSAVAVLLLTVLAMGTVTFYYFGFK